MTRVAIGTVSRLIRAPQPRSASRWRPFGVAVVLCAAQLAASPAADLHESVTYRTATRAYSERADAIDLEHAARGFRSGDLFAAVSHLRRVLDRPADSFVGSGLNVAGARASAESLLRGQTSAIRQLYEAAESASTKAAYPSASAIETECLREAVARFPTTEAGFHATNRLAAIAFDRGEFGTAARLWEGLLSDPHQAVRFKGPSLGRVVAALRLAGHDGRASELAVKLNGSAVRLRGEPAKIGVLLPQLSLSGSPIPTTAERGTAASGLTPPAFPPIWHHSFDPALVPLCELWEGSRNAEARPLATPAGAAWTDQGLVVRTPFGLSALDDRTGQVLWGAVSAEAEVGASAHGSLQDLTRFEASYASGGVYGRLTADADRVYVVDHIRAAWRGEARTAARGSAPLYDSQAGAYANRLVAYGTADSSGVGTPAWVAGEDGELADHYFLGPPCVTPDGLLVLAESRQCVSLLAIEPRTGSVSWRQPLGYVTRPVTADACRAATACVPAAAAGIAVCETNAGFAVAFDYISGRLLWVYDYAAAEPDAGGGRENLADRSRVYGDTSFPSPAVIRRESALLLPHDSCAIHCVDLRTGAVRWTSPREDGLYVACVTDSSAVVVGRSRCRSYSLASGSVLWSAYAGTPAGTGVVTDDGYLLPLEVGRIAKIDLAGGTLVGFDVPRDDRTFHPFDRGSEEARERKRWRPGNLYTDGLSLVSVGPTGVTRLRTAGAKSQGGNGDVAPLESARTDLAAGHLDAARDRLESLISSGPSPEDDESARMLLREIHFQRLEGDRESHTDALAELNRLSVSPAERGRFLLRAAENDLSFGDPNALRSRAEELSRLSPLQPLPVPVPGDPSLLVTPATWVRSLVRRGAESSPMGVLSDTALASVATEELVRRLPFLPDATPVRRELARRAAGEGDHQAAELLLLRNVEEGNGDPPVADSGLFGCDFGFASDEADAEAGARTAVSTVRVSGRCWSAADDGVCRAYGGMRRSFPIRGRDPLRVVDLGNSRQSRLAVVDLFGGVCLGEIPIDVRLRFPLMHRQPTRGHFVPVASVGEVHGLSLLEAHRGKPVWTTPLPGADGLLPQVGPYNGSFCTVQTRRELTALDPADGTILWRRTDLPPDRGLHADQAAGLFGDGETLTMLAADGSSYTTYRTQTGEELAAGRLPIDRQRPRRAYGRKLFFVETRDAWSAAKLWDPATNAFDLDIEFDGRLLQASTRDDELVLLFGSGRLLIYDVPAAAVRVDTVIAMREAADQTDPHTMWVFADGEKYYVSLVSDPRRHEELKVASFVYDSLLNAAHVQGRLLAIDRRTGDTLWSRPTEQRTVLDPVDHPAPFLIGIARVTDRRFGNRKTLLVEAIDRETGATLGVSDSLISDQPLQVRRVGSTIELAGLRSTAVLDYSARPTDGDIPLAAAAAPEPAGARRAALDSP